MADRAFLYRDKLGQHRWIRKAPNREVVGSSSEGYLHEADARANYWRVNGLQAPALEELSEPDTED